MHSGTGQPEHRVTNGHAVRQQSPALRRPDGKSREVIIALTVQPRHLRRLTAHQRAASLVAARGDTRDHLPRLPWLQLAGGEIVQEKQRLRPLHHDVVDAHRDQVDANRVVDPRLDRYLQLGPDPIGAGHQHRVHEARRLQVEQRPETAKPAHHPRPRRRLRQRLDRLHQRVARRDIHARGAIGQTLWLIASGHDYPRYATALGWRNVRNSGRMPDGSQIDRGGSAMLLTLPNVVTFARLCAVPLAVWLVMEHWFAQAFFLFVAAGLSDAVDGWLARRYGGNSVGALLDPVADKALLVTMYITLASVNVVPSWLAILVVFRDMVIVGGVVVLSLLGQSVMIRPLYVSKLNTVFQIVLVAAALLLSGFELTAPLVMGTLTWLVAATTLASGAAYVWITVRGR